MREVRGEYPQDVYIDGISEARVVIVRLKGDQSYEVRGCTRDLPASEYVYCGTFERLEDARREAAKFIFEQSPS